MQRHYVNDIEAVSVRRYADRRLRGRPPLAPLALEAAAFALDRRGVLWRQQTNESRIRA